ncbi:uncharacterized protein TRIADDRAFT_20356 [Trichoplax adhaerens]|uniref:E3 ubiquitin-protein ligase n=1 Tax=Trichoplax adhaerens TaxID=10228 RepID=B3RJJ3_TRIAD|nr:hypothetical protein TRIADDRAFT_20356 [Trichoplax adhaerens]EDV29107.1 hypothetical protein TRIADDRAFT_20356 [Trichoplax adhaerens]|eukprot:XP_002108309.1 hypothetical protein TRIADDRAFT_20356 [Trichoplax adhaerens]
MCFSSIRDKNNDNGSVSDNSPGKSLDNKTWFDGILSFKDLEIIDPHRAKFLRNLKELVDRKHEILNSSLSDKEKNDKLSSLTLSSSDDSQSDIKLEDLCLTFQYSPSSIIYGYETVDLIANGGEKILTVENVEEYVDLMYNFCFRDGIQRQIDAFKEGFDLVFPMESLALFTPEEARNILCGDQSPQWTKDDLLNYTEPKNGYTRESAGYLRFINVVSNFDNDERKAFLQFTTGCSSLPPGGLRNLHPHLTVVKKEMESNGTHPSVNTCVHYLKLPDYASEDILRDRLLAATKEKGFHLN